MTLRQTLALCAALALAACGSDSGKKTGGTAGGEILPASVSDAMLPYDTVRSQAPLAPRAEGGEGGGDDKDEDRSERRQRSVAPEPPAPQPAAEEPAEAEE